MVTLGHVLNAAICPGLRSPRPRADFGQERMVD